MSYKPLDHFHPDIANHKVLAVNSTRDNLANLRDFLCLTGYMPGWDCVVTDTAAPVAPDLVTFNKGVEVIKIALTWPNKGGGGNGSGYAYPSKAAFWYSADSGVSWSPLTDRQGNYVVTITYDADDNATSETWGTS